MLFRMAQSSQLSSIDLNYSSITNNGQELAEHAEQEKTNRTRRTYTRICIIKHCENFKGIRSSEVKMFR